MVRRVKVYGREKHHQDVSMDKTQSEIGSDGRKEEATELRGLLNHIALAFECTLQTQMWIP